MLKNSRIGRATPDRISHLAGPAGSKQLAPIIIVIVATLFNAALAVVNAHVVPITSSTVVGVEVLIVLAAHVTALANYNQQMTRWYILIWFLLVISLVRGMVTGDFEAKLLRDALLIPTFIVLGMTCSPNKLPLVVMTLLGVDAIFMLLEAVSTSTYASLFGIQSFYINTRGLTEATFWNKESPLFASATRPDGRFFNIIDLHRLSSVFLEPVGSETFCIVVWTYVCASFHRLSRSLRFWLVVGTLLMIVGTDGRLALVTSVIILMACVLAPKLPARLPFFYLPAVTLGVVTLVYMADMKFEADNFSGRLALSTHLLTQFDIAELLGLSNTLLAPTADAGLAYLIITQSLFGAIVLWGFITMGSQQQTITQIRYLHATSAWLALYMMVGAAFLSIKVAALLWFVYGSLQREGEYAGRKAMHSPLRHGTAVGEHGAWPEPARSGHPARLQPTDQLPDVAWKPVVTRAGASLLHALCEKYRHLHARCRSYIPVSPAGRP
jgi:putative polymerase